MEKPTKRIVTVDGVTEEFESLSSVEIGETAKQGAAREMLEAYNPPSVHPTYADVVLGVIRVMQSSYLASGSIF